MTPRIGFPTRFRSRGRWRTAAVLALLTLPSCHQWIARSDPVTSVLAEHSESKIRVTMNTGKEVVIERPRVAGDSLKGLRSGSSRAEGVPLDPVQVALADIRSVAVERLDGTRTTILALGVGVTVLALWANSSSSKPAQPKPQPTSTGGCAQTNDCSFSCPLVYSWDGQGWHLESGTFGGAIMEALERTDLSDLDHATQADGVLRLKVANELHETDYLDALHVLAVDHDPGLTVAPDPAGKIHTLGVLVAPVQAADFHGRDALARVRSLDGWNWESNPAGRDTAKLADIRDGLAIAFTRPAGAQHAHLVLDGNNTPWASYLLSEFIRAHGSGTEAWYDSLNAQPAAARAVGGQIAREAFLTVSIQTGDHWTPQGMFWEAGPEITKRQAIDLDLSGVRGDTVRVRLESIPSFWLLDRVAMDFSADAPVSTHDLDLIQANDLHGRDVRGLLASVDHQDFAMETGDGAELRFAVPEVPAGRARSYVVQSTGWYHVGVPAVGQPDVALLHRLAADPYGLSREAVARLTNAMATLSDARR